MADDLFDTWLPALWTKARPEGRPPIFMMHRFLASDPDFAEAARVLQRDLRDPDITFVVWQGLLPRAPGAPRLQYVAPRKPPAEEALVARIMAVEHWRRDVAEAAVEVARAAGRLHDAHAHYGVEVG